MQTILLNSLFVSALGGTFDILSDQGEVLATLGVPAGRIGAAQYLDLIPNGGGIDCGDGLALVEPASIGSVIFGNDYYDSGANPDFVPSSADQMQRHLRVMVAHLQQRADETIDARLRALDNIERIPKAPELIEKSSEPIKSSKALATDDKAIE